MIAIYMIADNATLATLQTLQGEALVQKLAELENADNAQTVDIGKLWDVLHFVLTNQSATMPVPASPLSEAIVGVETFSDDEDADFISYSQWSEVAEIVEALDKVDIVKQVNQQQLKHWRQKKLFPKGIWDDKKAHISKELIDSFNELKALYETALDNGDNVIVSIL